MTREDIIRMAQEAGWEEMACDLWGATFDGAMSIHALERFAELVRKDYSFTHAQLWLKRFDGAIRAEREACAKVAEQHPAYDWAPAVCEIAYAIRARGQA